MNEATATLKIIKNMNKLINEMIYDGAEGVSGVEWDDRTIVIEESALGALYWDKPNLMHSIIEKSCEGTGYFVEFENSCILHVCEL